MDFDMEKIIEDKRASSRRLAALPFAEKLRLLEALRDRALTIIASRPKRNAPRRSRQLEGNNT
jgi:hypothetical protein